MKRFNIWQTQVILNWSDVAPTGLTREDVIANPSVLERFWPHIGRYVKYVQKRDSFFMSLSKQNLQRLKKQFPDIELGQGTGNLGELKTSLAKFNQAVDVANKVKTTPELPGIPYKVSPLAEYQHRGTMLLTHTKAVPLFADCGCLAGDTLVKVNRAGKSITTTLEKLYKNQELNRGNRDPDVKTRIRAFKEDIIGLHPIKKVVQSGIKEVWQLTLGNGKSVKATPDHEILTERGFIELQNLTKKDFVMVDTIRRHKKKTVKSAAKKFNDRRVAVGEYHPFARYQPSHQGRSGSYLVEHHRALYDAKANRLSYDEFIERTYTGKIRGLKFCNPETHDIHHIDGDHYNNDPENLQLLTKAEHRLLHSAGYKGYKHFGHGTIEYSKVESIKKLGKEMTYDIVCEDPHRNFVANGIVVHNCGKTYMVLCSTEEQIRLGYIKPGKTLICGKLATLHHGWLEDAKKFTNLKVNVLWTGSSYKRKEKILAMLDDPADVYVINHEGVKVFEEALVAKQFEKVVIDESTVLKCFRGTIKGKNGREGAKDMKGASFGRAILNVAEHAEWRVIMSGTPAPNDPSDLWGQFKFLDPNGFILEPAFKDFQKTFMSQTFYGDRHDPKTPSSWSTTGVGRKMISDLVQPLTYRVKIRDHLLDLPEKTVQKRVARLEGDQESHYEKMVKSFYTTIYGSDGGEQEVTARIKLSCLQKLRQLTGGFVIDDQEQAHALESNPKLELLDSLLEDEIDKDNKVVIFAQYQWEIRLLEDRYKGYGTVTVYGDNGGSKNVDNLDRFLTDSSVRIIILHPRSAAHGVTLTNAHYLIFYSVSYSAEEDYQCVKRIERASQKNAMFVYYLLVQDTVDEIIYDVIQKKLANQSALIDPDGESKDIDAVWGRLVSEIGKKGEQAKSGKKKTSRHT